MRPWAELAGTYSAALRYARDKEQPHRVSILASAAGRSEPEAMALRSGTPAQLREVGALSAPVAEIFAAAMRSMEVPATRLRCAGRLDPAAGCTRCVTACPGDLSPARAETMAWDSLTLLKENGDGTARQRTTSQERSVHGPFRRVRHRDRCGAVPRAFSQHGTPSAGGSAQGRCTLPDSGDGGVHGAGLPGALRDRGQTMVRRKSPPSKRASSSYACGSPTHCRSIWCARAARPANLLPQAEVVSRALCWEQMGGASACLLLATDASGKIAWNISTTLSALQEGGLAEAICYRVATPRGHRP